MYYTVYKTTNIKTKKIYVGAHKTNNLNYEYLGSGSSLLKAIDKYGKNNFKKEILFVYDNPEDMFKKEFEIVNEEFVRDKNTYNFKTGGFGGWDYVNSKPKPPVTKQTRKKMSISATKRQTGNTNSFYGKSHSEEAKLKIGLASKKRAKAIYEQRIKDSNHPNSNTYCPHCNKKGQYRAMKRWHFDNCKFKPNDDFHKS